MDVKKEGALFCGGIYRDIVAVASRFPGTRPFTDLNRCFKTKESFVYDCLKHDF